MLTKYPLVYRDATMTNITTGVLEFQVKAYDDCGQYVTVATFPYDHFDGGKRAETAFKMAADLTHQINGAA